MSLEINEKCELIVRAPLRLNLNFIEDFIAKKRDWIFKKQTEISHRNKATEKSANEVWYLGHTYPLIIFEGDFKEDLIFTDRFFIAKHKLPSIRQILFNWYKKKALEIIPEKVQAYAVSSGLKFKSIKVNSAAKRWGSCTSSGNINFSYRLMMCPEFVIDYVIIHELAHLQEMNHSPRFWNLVAHGFPEYKKARKWLRDHGRFIK